MGFTKPALPGSAPSQPPSAGPSVAKSGAALPPSGSPLDQAATRQSSKAALDRYETEKHQSKYQPSPWDHEAAARDPVYARANSRYRSADDYYAQRDRDLSHLNYRTPQNIFIYNNMRPNYGFWDGLFLSMLLTHAMEPGYSDWAYAHRQDPAYQQWHQDALTLAEQNGELKAQVAALDNKVSEMQAKGVAPQSADQLPPGVSEAVAVAPTAVVAGQRSLAEGERAPNTALVVSQPVAEKEPSRTWIYLGVGAVLVAGFFWLRRRA